jgi:hypothetical protein
MALNLAGGYNTTLASSVRGDQTEMQIMEEILDPAPRDSLATNRLGAIALAKVVLRALEKGVAIYTPLMEGRCDLILDDGLKLYRTQVKYAGGSTPKQCQGAVPLRLRKWKNGGRRIIPYYTTKEIDLLLVYVRRIDSILWLGPEVFDGRRSLMIRIEQSKNNQAKGCLLASNYVW